METRKVFTVTHRVVMTADSRRNEAYFRADIKGLKRKLRGAFSLEKALEFPMYKWLPSLDEHEVDYYYKPATNPRLGKDETSSNSPFDLLLDNLPGWSVLPKRETCAKVYSNINIAIEPFKKSDNDRRRPGRIYRVVPALNSQLLIAPAAHIWQSFPYALEQLGVTGGGNSGFPFDELFVACGMGDGFPADWRSFLEGVNDIAFERIRPVGNVWENAKRLFAILGENKGRIIEFLDNAFSPLHNGFKLVNYKDQVKANEYLDNEIWTASSCLLIEEELFKGMNPFKALNL